MDDLYRDYVLEHYRHPHNSGRLDNPDVTAAEDNPLCGDRITLDLKIEHGRVVDVRFQGRGCAISQAAASMLSDLIKGKTVAEVAAVEQRDLLDELGIPLSPVRQKCATLCLKVLKSGLSSIEHWTLSQENGGGKAQD